jgi:hypothetical protein
MDRSFGALHLFLNLITFFYKYFGALHLISPLVMQQSASAVILLCRRSCEIFVERCKINDNKGAAHRNMEADTAIKLTVFRMLFLSESKFCSCIKAMSLTADFIKHFENIAFSFKHFLKQSLPDLHIDITACNLITFCK